MVWGPGCPVGYFGLLVGQRGPAGPRIGSGLLLVGSVPRLQDCSFLPSGICPLMGEAHLEPTADLLLGRAMSGQGWVVMGLGPLMGRDMSRGGYGLRKFLKQPVC